MRFIDFLLQPLKTSRMNPEPLKQAMLAAISKEVEQWADESQQIKDGYEFEKGAQQIVNLRAYQKSKRWDEVVEMIKMAA